MTMPTSADVLPPRNRKSKVSGVLRTTLMYAAPKLRRGPIGETLKAASTTPHTNESTPAITTISRVAAKPCHSRSALSTSAPKGDRLRFGGEVLGRGAHDCARAPRHQRIGWNLVAVHRRNCRIGQNHTCSLLPSGQPAAVGEDLLELVVDPRAELGVVKRGADAI